MFSVSTVVITVEQQPFLDVLIQYSYTKIQFMLLEAADFIVIKCLILLWVYGNFTIYFTIFQTHN